MVDLAVGAAGGMASNVAGNGIYDKMGLGSVNKMDELLEELRRLIDIQLKSVDTFTQTKIVNLSPNVHPSAAGAIVGGYLADNRYRNVRFLLSQAAASADEFVFRIGSTNVFSVFNPTGNAVWIPFPLPINDGMEVVVTDVTTGAATNWRCYMYADSIEEL